MITSPITATRPLILLCRETFEQALLEEVRAKLNAQQRDTTTRLTVEAGQGLVKISGTTRPVTDTLPSAFIFERQRLNQAVWLENLPLKRLAREIAVRLLPDISRSHLPWSLHTFAANPDSDQPLTRRAANLRDIFLEFCAQRFTVVVKRYRPPERAATQPPLLVLQLCLAPQGLWGSVMPLSQLTDPCPGGIHRMHFDPQAPSRSYLKIEEVFERMGQMPKSRQRVVDLGAAPGGWSYAFLKRGCQVLAVDHGPMKLKSHGDAGGRLVHLRENGISFRPPADQPPVDWLVSDMLIPPGKTLGMIRKWLEEPLTRRFVFNVKLPQQHPYPVLKPIEDYLRRIPGLRFQMRQLYHDRREITVFGVREE
ncbi:MAG: hypothetical protein KKE37_07145 [Verrucomicrobia bacterium]|nr:hypothetical protein [Verrucomicrobiota bacterium]MBU4291544.1 hypothetical protein [Verrucomicrobiota bacterium]MBU4429113.1 hypothetical protein [Verrucomicrobiota bacterium]MCG2678623.1 hypothetical protein [Kiritimatiellia bacterium]